MAKKRSSRGDFNMSEEIRNLLKENPKLSSREVYEELQKRFPNQTINRNSSNVAFSHARRKLNIRPSRRSVRRRRPGRQPAQTTTVSRKSDSLDLSLLRQARKFVSEAGSPEKAVNAINQVASLQFE